MFAVAALLQSAEESSESTLSKGRLGEIVMVFCRLVLSIKLINVPMVAWASLPVPGGIGNRQMTIKRQDSIDD